MPVINLQQINPLTDITTTNTLLHEVIPITGTILAGTYGGFPNENNVKNYIHGMFQSIYDYPYLSSSANHLMDLTMGYDEQSALYNPSHVQNSKKTNMYNQMAQILLGYTSSTADSIRKFEKDLQLDGSGAMQNVFFMSLSRLLTKDEIKRNSFSITLGKGNWATPWSSLMTLADMSASYGSNGGVGSSVGGDYGVLYDVTSSGVTHGVVFYQAGIVALSSSIFRGVAQFNQKGASYDSVAASFTGSSMTSSCNAFRRRIKTMSFNNTTEINSTIYFCRIPHNQFNYSSNPTYVTGSKIRVKNVASDPPVSYLTTVGLYNAAGEMLAVAKVSEPLRKDNANDITIRVRLDY
tara:strand:+ start:87598 stop:88650 length:1053 start_codon:yes stop_codon:yes gene_type:complete